MFNPSPSPKKEGLESYQQDLHSVTVSTLIKGYTRKKHSTFNLGWVIIKIFCRRNTTTSSSSCWFCGSRSGGGLPSINKDVFNCKFGNGTCNETSVIPVQMNGNGIKWEWEWEWECMKGNECHSSVIGFLFETCMLLS